MKERRQNCTTSSFPDPATRLVRKGSNFKSPCFAQPSEGPRVYLLGSLNLNLQPSQSADWLVVISARLHSRNTF